MFALEEIVSRVPHSSKIKVERGIWLSEFIVRGRGSWPS